MGNSGSQRDRYAYCLFLLDCTIKVHRKREILLFGIKYAVGQLKTQRSLRIGDLWQEVTSLTD